MPSTASNVIYLNVIPRNVAHDVTETDLAAQMRRGMVTKEEVAARFESLGFAQWMQRQGLEIWRTACRERGDAIYGD